MIYQIRRLAMWIAPILAMMGCFAMMGCSVGGARGPESLLRDAGPTMEISDMAESADLAVDDMARDHVLVCDLDCDGFPAGSNCMLQQYLCDMPDLTP